MRKISKLLIILGLSLAACGQGGPQTGQLPTIQPATSSPLSTAVVQQTPQPTAALPTTASQPSATTIESPAASSPASNQSSDAIVRQAQQRLAAHLGVDVKILILKSMSVQEWPDGSLGCPAPD